MRSCLARDSAGRDTITRHIHQVYRASISAFYASWHTDPLIDLGQTYVDMPLPTRKIGQHDVTAIGYGAMGIAAFYGTPLPDEERLKVCESTMDTKRRLVIR